MSTASPTSPDRDRCAAPVSGPPADPGPALPAGAPSGAVSFPAERVARRPPYLRMVAGAIALLALLGYLGYRIIDSNPVPGITGHELTAAAFYESDWQFRLGTVNSHADKDGAWDYDDCASAGDAEMTELLAAQGCEYGIEGRYVRSDLDLTIYQRVFVFGDQSAAGDAEDAVVGPDLHDRFRFHDRLPSDAVYNTEVGASDVYLVVTVSVRTATDVSVEADDAFGFFHTDHLNALLFQ